MAVALQAVQPEGDDVLPFPVERLHQLHHAAGDVLASSRTRSDWVLDETFHFVMDAEFWIRAAQAGLRLVHLPRKLATFRLIEGTKFAVEPDGLLGGLPRNLPSIPRRWGDRAFSGILLLQSGSPEGFRSRPCVRRWSRGVLAMGEPCQ